MTVNLNGVNPFVKEKAEQLIKNANVRLKNYKMGIVQAYRSKAEQDALFAKGRRGIPGEGIVTKARGGQSMHNFGLAIDFALFSPDGKKASWDTSADFDKDGKADWMEVVEEAKKLGFEWGGDWRGFKDCPHFQMLGGLTESQVRAGKVPSFKTATIKKAATKEKEKKPTATDNKSVVPYPGKVLDIGSEGKDVQRVQRAVGVDPDGIYGKGTKKAVQAYQKRHGLTADGITGKNTWNVMF
ncbi:M15 family metallopeptidase [Niallia sp. 03190]|uniref:M15 family metallopeptidase n=1 Tax=Niallia sp. 03190 TaxID=3458061 RepID=UPI004043E5F1